LAGHNFDNAFPAGAIAAARSFHLHASQTGCLNQERSREDFHLLLGWEKFYHWHKLISRRTTHNGNFVTRAKNPSSSSIRPDFVCVLR
jgi:hypothetical protein